MRLISVFIILCKTLFAQENLDASIYARKILDTLTSPVMHGRGYLMQGDSIAANYISSEFIKAGLSSFSDNYFQHYTLSVNCFNGAINFNDKKITTEFTINPDCPTIKGKYKIVKADTNNIKTLEDVLAFQKQDLKNKFLLVDTFHLNKKHRFNIERIISLPPINTKGIIVYNPVRKNGTYAWDLAQNQSLIPVIQIPHSKDTLTNVNINIKATLIKSYRTKNVVGYVKGTEMPDSFIVFTAHYDHLGELKIKEKGKPIYFPGANDNASGVSMLLCLAKYYATHPQKYSVAFIAFSGEELGLCGSDYYTSHPLFDLKKIKFLVNMDIFGTGDEGIMVVNGAAHKTQFDLLTKINADKNLLSQIKMRKKAPISDHYNFDKYGVNTFYIYTLGGVAHYHDKFDTSATLPLTEFKDIYTLLIEFVSQLN
jgi:hypothetical protein